MHVHACMYVCLAFQNSMFFPCVLQEDIVLTWLFSIFVEASKSQFKHEQFSEQLPAGNGITNESVSVMFPYQCRSLYDDVASASLEAV